MFHCPDCGAEVELELECPGYGENPTMVCYPACGNMVTAECGLCAWRWSNLRSKRTHYAGWSDSTPPVGWKRPIEPILDLSRRGPGTVRLTTGTVHLSKPE